MLDQQRFNFVYSFGASLYCGDCNDCSFLSYLLPGEVVVDVADDDSDDAAAVRLLPVPAATIKAPLPNAKLRYDSHDPLVPVEVGLTSIVSITLSCLLFFSNC